MSHSSNSPTDTTLRAKSEARLDDTPKEQRTPTKLEERKKPRTYVNKLTPPPGTNYWRHQILNIMQDQELIYKRDFPFNQETLVETLTWNIDAYIYIVDAQPGDNFAGRGGSVYVVLVHTGSAATGAMVGPHMQYRYNVTMNSPPGGSSAMKQLPPSSSGTHNGDMWNYPISFTQDMQMFTDGGNQLTTFTAQYEDSVDIYKGQQTGFVNGSSGTQWNVSFDDYPDYYYNFPFVSVSVFRFTSLGEVTFECKAAVYSDESSDTPLAEEIRSITVDCTFPSEA
ncbi:hypothetical protein ONZ45_g13276 [Pleurotus djamor]|nr:hypothetical protein ONZ45_g13276 [Pleurotus djamor]